MALKVRDLMTADPKTVHRDAPMDDVYELMMENRFRHVPVVDGADELVGLISHRDVIGLLGEQHRTSLTKQAKRLSERSAGSVMLRVVETIDPDEDLAEAASRMYENKLGCLPVVEGAHLVGILTEADFVRYVAELE